jgi:lipoprotein-releasing system ATP-binding protein
MSETNSPILSVRNVRRAFKAGERNLEVLHGVNLDVAPRERLCLMGSSGAGKTTLLNIIGLLDRPDEGQVILKGQDAWALPNSGRAGLRNHTLGFVFQFYHLLPELNALENTTLPARLAGARVPHRIWPWGTTYPSPRQVVRGRTATGRHRQGSAHGPAPFDC